jgi:hypothetical protein
MFQFDAQLSRDRRIVVKADEIFQVAHASRVLAMASSPSRTLPFAAENRSSAGISKPCCFMTPQPTRETRVRDPEFSRDLAR